MKRNAWGAWPVALAAVLLMPAAPVRAQLGDALGGMTRALQQFDINAVLKQARETDRECERLVDAPDIAHSAAQLTGLVAMARGQMARSGNVMKDRRIIESAKSLLWVPVDYEHTYAEALHQARIAEGTAVEASDMDRRERERFSAAEALLATLVGLLPQDQPYRYRLFLSTESGQNAQALPGGYIYVTAAALDGGPELLATLLAHEVAHVSKRHHSRRLQARLLDQVRDGEDLVALLRGDRAVLQRVGREAQQREQRGVRFSMDQELEADACAVRIVASYPDVDATRSVGAFLAMLQQEGAASAQAEGGACAAFGDCHPSYRERERTMRSMIARGPSGRSRRDDAGPPLEPASSGRPARATGRGGPWPGLNEELRSLERIFTPRR